MPGPETEPLAERIRTTAQPALAPLHRADGRARRRPHAVRRRRDRPSDGPVRGASRSLWRRFPTGGFMPDSGSLTGFAAASQWVVVVFMVLAGINFALVFRALVRRRWRSAARIRSSGSISESSPSPPWPRRRALGGRPRDGGGGDPPRRLPGRLDHDDDRVRERRLRLLDDVRPDAARRPDVRRRLRRLDRQLGQGRAPSPRSAARSGASSGRRCIPRR